MKTLDEVIKGLELCHARKGCFRKNCPYENDNDYKKQVNCFDVLEDDMLHYLQQLKALKAKVKALEDIANAGIVVQIRKVDDGQEGWVFDEDAG